MINQLFFIMADNDSHDSIGRLLTYLNYRFGKAMWYPIPPGSGIFGEVRVLKQSLVLH